MEAEAGVLPSSELGDSSQSLYHLWSLCRWCPPVCECTELEVPGLAHPFHAPHDNDLCLSSKPRLFLGLPQVCYISTPRLSSQQSIPVISLGSDLQGLCLSTQPPPPWRACKQMSHAEGCWLAPTSMQNFLCFALHMPIASLLGGSETSPCPHQ